MLFLICFLVKNSFADSVWLQIKDKSLKISSGSILDFTFLAGQFSDGKLRFFCASQPFGVEEGFPDHVTADAYARQLKLHGYNLARFVFVENVLMAGRTCDFDFDPKQLDRFHYFLAALKREGVGWLLDGLTSQNGAYGDVGRDRWAKKRNVKAGLYYDPEQQAHWKQLVHRILFTQNPYTGMRILEDPALYGVILVNEGGLNHIVNLDPDPRLDHLFDQWLTNRYGTAESARLAWGIHGPNGGHVVLPRRIWSANPWVNDAQRFYYDSQREAFRWMSDYIRGLGYQGLITAFNNWPNLQDQATRAQLSWVDMHAYHEEPSRFVQLGSHVSQTSSLVGGLEYVRHLANARYWGKPYTVSEHGHPFWNRWRYESGLAVGAYAAFQEWDLICRHGSGPIELGYGMGKSSRRKAIYPYGIGMDPIERANETLTALLYLRGDVRPSQHRVGIRLSEEYVFDQRGGIGRLPKDVTSIGLVTGVGLIWNDQKPDDRLDVLIDPGGAMSTLSNKMAVKTGLGGEPTFSDLLTELQERGLLAGNISDGKNIFVSDTGEIVFEPHSKLLKVITPRTEAAAYEHAPGKLDSLTISQSSGPALLAASSMDGRQLNQSRRILLILATDARNSGMQFADKDEKELRRLGGLPVLIRSINVAIQIKNDNHAKMSLYALHLNGERAQKLPMNISVEDAISFEIDTQILKFGPTTFFELVAE